MSRFGTESDFELATIERLRHLGYGHRHGSLVDRKPQEVVLVDTLKESLRTRYPHLRSIDLTAAVNRITSPEGVEAVARNRHFHVNLLARGFELTLDKPLVVAEAQVPVWEGRTHAPRPEVMHIHPIDWERPERNVFEVVNQLAVTGMNERRFDLIVYVNGLPLVLFELKNPADDYTTVEGAINQIRNYTALVPALFDFNAFCVASDGANTRHGMWTSGDEHYGPWKSVDGRTIVSEKLDAMKTLIEGLFPKDRLLQYIRDFVAFEGGGSGEAAPVKKGAKYHQFFAVRFALERTLSAFGTDEQKIGVIWHTTGSGKSLSMAFLVGILRRHTALNNPTVVIQVDRNDLDDQLHDQFTVLKHLVGGVHHADGVDDLRALLSSGGGDVIFTTIEKFMRKPGEPTHPLLSERNNIIVIADEAHRSQYGFLEGYARSLRDALPRARRLGFTGTPVSLHDADTLAVFGDYIHTYDMRQSKEDGATVGIYYAPRQAALSLGAGVDAALMKITDAAAIPAAVVEQRKAKWAALALIAGAGPRLGMLAADLLAHFNERSRVLVGKAMVVCMTREICVKLYKALKALPQCPEIAVVMTGDLAKDPKEWSELGFITTKPQRDAIKKRMIDPENPLKIVIVCDMWLTGTDIPCLHTLYIDKPMQGHSIIQAISRVNRVFRDKPHGIIVDYIGVGEELRAASEKYRDGKGKGAPAANLDVEGLAVFLACLAAIRALYPPDLDPTGWRSLSPVQRDDHLIAAATYLLETDARRDAFLDAQIRLASAYLLAQHLGSAAAHTDDVLFCQGVRSLLRKTMPPPRPGKGVEKAVRDLLDEKIDSAPVVDLYKRAGIDTPDVSILDEAFLQTFKDRPHADLRLKLLIRLLQDDFHRRSLERKPNAKRFEELLQATLAKYHKRAIDAAAVVKAMVDLKTQADSGETRATALGLTAEEYAFYVAVEADVTNVYDEPMVRDLIHEVVRCIKSNVKVGWTEGHRDDVKATVSAAVKRVLRRSKIGPEDLDRLAVKLLAQAELLYANWPLAA